MGGAFVHSEMNTKKRAVRALWSLGEFLITALLQRAAGAVRTQVLTAR